VDARRARPVDADELTATFAEAISSGAGDLVVDISVVTFMDASTMGVWAADLLEADGARVHLVHPLGLHWDARRVKNDERDATELAHRLRRGDLPESWIAPAEVRELRELIRYRAKLAALRTSAKAQIHAVMAKLGILPTLSDMFCAAGQVLLDEMPFEGCLRDPGRLTPRSARALRGRAGHGRTPTPRPSR
jgi:transposase